MFSSKNAHVEQTRSTAMLDVGLAASGVGIGLVSLLFPFGRDQGIFHYVGREWLVRGSIPYRDLFDDQTPGIYAIHAIAIACFGETIWGIRLLDLVCIVLLGLIAATFSTAPNASVSRGVRGASVLIASILYYGFLNFWDTGQVEIWCSMLGLASIWAARRMGTRIRADILSGVLASLAMIVKPPSAWFGLCALVICVLDVWGERPDRVQRAFGAGLRFMLGVALPLGLTLSYLGMQHALTPMFEILIDCGGYVGRESRIHGLSDVVNATLYQYQSYAPASLGLVATLVIATALSHRRGDIQTRNRHLLSGLLCILGFLAVLVQRRFFGFHWVMLIGPATAVGANAVVDIVRLSNGKSRATRVGIAILAASAWLCSAGFRSWIAENKAGFVFVSHRLDREDFMRTFSIPTLGFSAHDTEQAGLWIKSHSSPDDLVSVRGFEPEIYAISARHHSGRFFYTIFVTSPTRGYRQADWYAEDQRDLSTHPPRFVVAPTAIHIGPEAPESFTAQGYEVATTIGDLTVLEHRK